MNHQAQKDRGHDDGKGRPGHETRNDNLPAVNFVRLYDLLNVEEDILQSLFIIVPAIRTRINRLPGLRREHQPAALTRDFPANSQLARFVESHEAAGSAPPE